MAFLLELPRFFDRESLQKEPGRSVIAKRKAVGGSRGKSLSLPLRETLSSVSASASVCLTARLLTFPLLAFNGDFQALRITW